MLLAMRRESEHHHAAVTATVPPATTVTTASSASASAAAASAAVTIITSEATPVSSISATTNGLLVPSVSSALQLSPNLSVAANVTSCTLQHHHLQQQQQHQQQYLGLQQHAQHLQQQQQQQQADSLNTPTTPLLNLGRSPLQFPPPPPPPVPVQAGPQFGFYTPSTGAATYLHPHYTSLPSAVPTSVAGSSLVSVNTGSASFANGTQRCSSAQSTELDATESPSSRRMLLDYPSPYLYSNHYHTSPSEDLVALWFGSNGSANLLPTADIGPIEWQSKSTSARLNA
ncbi:unnamed protein product [Ceratitis capitata]|uniref:(Mediterranean fruit fly) hypothetical protein n=1 Tax=Ceratitis capitata TaxID=7213 RepID=A0A811V765_CERCA|nr:unnamed protein product [Ceratitis capitata]